MHGLPELRIPEDWRRRTRVFVTAAKVRHGLAPLVSREVYAAERSLPATAGPPPPQPAKKKVMAGAQDNRDRRRSG